MRTSLNSATLVDVLCAILLISITFSIGLAVIQQLSAERSISLRGRAWILAESEIQSNTIPSIGVMSSQEKAGLVIETRITSYSAGILKKSIVIRRVSDESIIVQRAVLISENDW